MGYARQQRGIVNLVAVEIQDRQHSTIPNGIEKLVDVPRSSERASLGFSVADNCRNDQFRIIEGRTTRVGQHISQLTTFMNRTRCFWSAMTSDAAGKRKLFEEAP